MRRPYCCAGAAPLCAQFTGKQIALSQQPATYPLCAFGRDKNGAERGIYLTFGDARVIISNCKAYLRHQMCPERLPEEHQTNVPFVRRRHLWRVGPSTRGATAPQGAQQVNFVVRWATLFKNPSCCSLFCTDYKE